MATKAVLAVLVLCAVCVNSYDFFGRSDRTPEYVRIKRAKYYSSPPMRFYRRPPNIYPVKGPFSYTPPPNYMEHDAPSPFPGSFRPKVSNRPTNDGLEDEDINRIVKHLSKQDLDKLIQFAGEKYRDTSFEKYSSPFHKIPIKDTSGFSVYKSTREPETDSRFPPIPMIETSSINAFKLLQELETEPKFSPIPIKETNSINAYKLSQELETEPKFPSIPIKETSSINAYKSLQEPETQPKFPPSGHYVTSNFEPTNHYDMEYSDNSRPPAYSNTFRPSQPDDSQFKGPPANVYNDVNDKFNYVQNGPPELYQNSQAVSPQDFNNGHLHTEESMQTHQFTFVDAQIQQELYGSTETPGASSSVFTSSETFKEEQLPKPLNLREDEDHQVAYTNNAPTVVKADPYKVESFSDLPLMDYNSKLDSVSSYHVPHYTVVSHLNQRPSPPATSYGSPQSYSSPSSSSQLVSSPSAAALKVPKVEPAPPVSLAKEQSDAHLKAVNIWTHKSKGTAYTLHDDGTLSLEKPQRPKATYGP